MCAIFILFLVYFLCIGVLEAVNISINGLDVIVKNDYLTANFSNGIGSGLIINGTNIAKRFYIDSSSTGNKTLSGHFYPTSVELLLNTNDLVHFAFVTNNASFEIEQHFMVTSSISGIYQYVVIKNGLANQVLSEDEIRMQWRMNNTIMPVIHNGKIQVVPPPANELNITNKVEDATFLLTNGSYYTKYDLAGYIRERNYYGVLGGGYGTWIIHPSHEYFSGGPLKQDLLVHQYGLVFIYMTGAHFGTPHLKMNPGFEKLYGPWLVYFNQGTNEELVEDVKQQVEREIKKWPYTFINDVRYPIFRGTVVGKVEGVQTMVVVSPQDEDYNLQVHGNSYNTKTINGSFNLENVRSGNYLLSIYPLSGASVGTLLQKNITVTSNQTTDAGIFKIEEPINLIWQIGKVDYRSSEFMYSNEKRNYKWHLEVPAYLNFTVGSSNAETDWYYAQTKPGNWTVKFEDVNDGQKRSLWLSIAACSFAKIARQDQPQLNVYLNKKCITTLDNCENDQSIYRCALQSGNYHYLKIDDIPPEVIQNGTNFVSLELLQGMLMYDSLVYLRS